MVIYFSLRHQKNRSVCNVPNMDKSLNFILFSLYYHPHSIAIFCHFVAVKAFFVLLSDCAVPHWVYSAVLSQSLAGIKECCHWKESRVCCVDHLLCPFLSKLFFKRQVAICPQTKGDQALSPSPHPSSLFSRLKYLGAAYSSSVSTDITLERNCLVWHV